MDYRQSFPGSLKMPPAYSFQTAGDYPHLPSLLQPLHQYYIDAIQRSHETLSYTRYREKHSVIGSAAGVQEPYSTHRDNGFGDEQQCMLSGQEVNREHKEHQVSCEASLIVNDDKMKRSLSPCSSPNHENVSKRSKLTERSLSPHSYLNHQNVNKQYKSNNFRASADLKFTKSEHCEICKTLYCPSNRKSHIDSKAHKRKLKRLQSDIILKVEKALASEPAGKGEAKLDMTKRLNGSKIKDYLETKKKRTVENGGYADECRVCTICQVVAYSQNVYNDHLKGQKHANKVAYLERAKSGY